MDRKEIEKINLRSLEKWGGKLQLIKTSEECSELIQSISKYLIDQGDIDSIKEEIADVFIIVRQLRTLFGKKEIDEIIDKKMKIVIDKIEGDD
mgnify:CR=1 FL=1